MGRFLLAFLAIRILSRRNLLRVFLVPGLILVPLIFIFRGLAICGSYNMECSSPGFSSSRN